MTDINNLGIIITNNKIRKIIYGIYVILAIILGGIVAYYFGIGKSLPIEIIGAQAVFAYLAIPIGALALANTSPKIGVPPISNDNLTTGVVAS